MSGHVRVIVAESWTRLRRLHTESREIDAKHRCDGETGCDHETHWAAGGSVRLVAKLRRLSCG